MGEHLTEYIVKGLVETGLEKGTVQTDLGEAVVLSAMKGGVPCFTVTFVDMEEKWMVQGTLIQAMKYVPAMKGDLRTLVTQKENKHLEPQVPESVTVEGEEQKQATIAKDHLWSKYINTVGLPSLTETLEGVTVINGIKPKSKRGRKAKRVRGKPAAEPDAPRVERPKTKLGKAKGRGEVIKEQPPTVRAYKGRPVNQKAKATAKLKRGGWVKGLVIPKPVKVDRHTGKVPKIGPKKPIWRRQLGWDGKPEKVDVNLYPVKILCVNDGQPRYINIQNSRITTHPITMCKACAKRHRSQEHDRKVREKRVRIQALADKDRAIVLRQGWGKPLQAPGSPKSTPQMNQEQRS